MEAIGNVVARVAAELAKRPGSRFARELSEADALEGFRFGNSSMEVMDISGGLGSEDRDVLDSDPMPNPAHNRHSHRVPECLVAGAISGDAVAVGDGCVAREGLNA